MKNEIKLAIDGYDDIVKEIKDIEKKSEKVTQRTIGDFKRSGPGWVTQEVVKVYGIAKKDVNSHKKEIRRGKNEIKIRGNTIDDIAIVYRGRELTPTHFSMKPTSRPVGNEPYIVSARIKKKEGRKELGQKVFLASASKSSTMQIPFQRTEEAIEAGKRYPIKSVKTVSVPQMITNEEVSKNIHRQINVKLRKRFRHNMKYIYGKK